MRGVLVENRGMVKHIHNFVFDNTLEIGKVDDHTVFNIVLVGNWRAQNSDRQFVTVAMDVAAFAVVSIKGMPGFESKHLGDADLTHGVKIQYFGLKPMGDGAMQTSGLVH